MKAAQFAQHLLRHPNAARAVMALIAAEVAADRESMHLPLETVAGYPDTTAEARDITELGHLIDAASAADQPAADRGDVAGLAGLTLRVVSDPHGEESAGRRITAGLVPNAELMTMHGLDSETAKAISRSVPDEAEAGDDIRELLVPASAIGGLELLGWTGAGETRAAAPPSAVAELVALAHELEVKELELDERVHDVASRAGSDVNNEGLEGQIAFLIQRLGAEETRRIVEQATQQHP
jgi:hypothetical protein